MKPILPLGLCACLLSAPAFALPFLDDFSAANPVLWSQSSGWANGSPFAVGWRADHTSVGGGQMGLRLDDQPCAGSPEQCSGQPYASGEYRSNDFYGYGRVSGSLRAAAGSGLVTSLFTYTGPSDGNPWDEIDIEILGKDTRKLQLNYFSHGVGGHEVVVDLGFDAALGFHAYAFEWSADAIRWFVDGALVHTATGTDLPTTPGRIMANLWAVDGTASGWAGPFAYGGPVSAAYDWIGYAALPAPGSLSLLLGGVGMLAWRRRERRPQSAGQ